MWPQTQRVTQVQRCRLLHEDGIGTRLDHEAVGVLGSNDPAEARRSLEEQERNSARRELVRGRQACDSAADDCNERWRGYGL
jgi:hypothetical protein